MRADGTFQKSDEQTGRDVLAKFEKVIARKDYLIVAFPHLGTNEFPNLMRRLDKGYALVFSQLSRGHGFAVFKRRVLEPEPR